MKSPKDTAVPSKISTGALSKIANKKNDTPLDNAEIEAGVVKAQEIFQRSNPNNPFHESVTAIGEEAVRLLMFGDGEQNLTLGDFQEKMKKCKEGIGLTHLARVTVEQEIADIVSAICDVNGRLVQQGGITG